MLRSRKPFGRLSHATPGMITCSRSQLNLRSDFWRPPARCSPEAGKRGPRCAHRPMRTQVRASFMKPLCTFDAPYHGPAGHALQPDRRSGNDGLVSFTNVCVRLAKMDNFVIRRARENRIEIPTQIRHRTNDPGSDHRPGRLAKRSCDSPENTSHIRPSVHQNPRTF